MGIFDSNSKKQTTNVTNTDNRALNAAGNTGIAVFGEGISVLDGGAIDSAFDAFDKNSEMSYRFASGALDYAMAESAASRAEAFNAVDMANNRIADVYRTEAQTESDRLLSGVKQLAYIGAGLTALVIAVRAFK